MNHINSVSWTLQKLCELLKVEDTEKFYDKWWGVFQNDLTEKQLKLMKALYFVGDTDKINELLKEWEFIYDKQPITANGGNL